MTELIDEFQSNYPKGRNKALTSLILTSFGTALKLAWTCLIGSLVFGGKLYMSQKEKFVFATILIVCIWGILNFAGSLMLFKRKPAGIWVYLISQLITVLIITWCTLVVNHRLQEEEQLFLLITYAVTGIFVTLYLTNRKYWGIRKQDDDRIN